MTSANEDCSISPKITILITNYNYAQFVSDAIESALAQSYSNIEVVVVDDGSADESVAVIQRYPGVRLISKQNGGQVSAAIDGIGGVSSELVIFLDSDDRLYPNACEEVVAHYKKDVSLIQYRLDKVKDGNIVGSYPDYPFMSGNQKEHVVRYGFIHTAPTSGNAFSVKHVKRMLEIVDLGGERMNGVDGYLIFSAPFSGDVVSINKSLGVYNIHGENISLSAGRTLKTVENSINVSAWQRTGYLFVAGLCTDRAILKEVATLNLAANQYRNALIVRRGYGSCVLKNLTSFELAVKSFVRFIGYPGMGLLSRFAHASFALLLLLMPPAICRRIIPNS